MTDSSNGRQTDRFTPESSAMHHGENLTRAPPRKHTSPQQRQSGGQHWPNACGIASLIVLSVAAVWGAGHWLLSVQAGPGPKFVY